MTATAHRSRHWLWPPLLLLGGAVVCLAWATLAASTGKQMGWMIVIGAIEACWMLSLGGLRRSRLRVAVALAATFGMFVVGNTLIGAMLTGQLMGAGLLESSSRIGLPLATSYAQLRNGAFELLMLGIALLLAWRLAR